ETLEPTGPLFGPPDGQVVQSALDPEGKRLLTVSAEGDAQLWDAGSGAAIGKPFRHTNTVIGRREPLSMADFSPDGRLGVTATGADYGGTGEVRVWDAATGQPVTPILRHERWARFATFSPDGRFLVTEGSGSRVGSSQGWEVRVWEVAT